MQARSSTTGQMVAWQSDSLDWAGGSYPGDGSPQHIAAIALPASPGGGDVGEEGAVTNPNPVLVGEVTRHPSPDLGYGDPFSKVFHVFKSGSGNIVTCPANSTVTIDSKVEARDDAGGVYFHKSTARINRGPTGDAEWFADDGGAEVSPTGYPAGDTANKSYNLTLAGDSGVVAWNCGKGPFSPDINIYWTIEIDVTITVNP